MHIRFVCHHYAPEIGAPQRRWNAFVSVWRSQGIDVSVVTALPHYPTGRMLPDHRARDLLGSSVGEHGETVFRVPFLPIGSRGGALKLANQAFVAGFSSIAGALGSRPDVVVSSIPGPATLAAGDTLAARWRVPHVLELRDAWPDLLYEGSPEMVRIPAAFGRWMTRRQRSADAVVSVTSSFAEVLVRRGIHPTRIHHVANGIDVTKVPELPPPTPHEGPLRVLYLGTHGVSQGLENAVVALAAAGNDVVEARFVGEGSEKAGLKSLARDLDAPIEFIPQVQGDALWESYRWADTSLVHLADWPSFDYTVPSKLYEVLALGRHVTGVVRGEAARIIEEAGGGVRVTPNDPAALSDALRHLSEDRSSLARALPGRQWVQANADLTQLAKSFLRTVRGVVNR